MHIVCAEQEPGVQSTASSCQAAQQRQLWGWRSRWRPHLTKRSCPGAAVERRDLKCIGWQRPGGSGATESQWQEKEYTCLEGMPQAQTSVLSRNSRCCFCSRLAFTESWRHFYPTWGQGKLVGLHWLIMCLVEKEGRGRGY